VGFELGATKGGEHKQKNGARSPRSVDGNGKGESLRSIFRKGKTEQRGEKAEKTAIVCKIRLNDDLRRKKTCGSSKESKGSEGCCESWSTSLRRGGQGR